MAVGLFFGKLGGHGHTDVDSQTSGAVMGAGLYGWSVGTKQVRRLWRLLRPPTIVWITPELALGPSFHKEQIRTLARAGIGSVIDLRSEASDDEDLLARRGLHLYRVPVGDRGAPTEAQLNEVTRWALREIAAGRKVYVHCQGGIGRSPAVAAAILVAMGHSLSDAYNTVRRRRPWVSLSSVQCEALEQFERSLRARRSLEERERRGPPPLDWSVPFADTAGLLSTRRDSAGPLDGRSNAR